jgi:hypothetical protein
MPALSRVVMQDGGKSLNKQSGSRDVTRKAYGVRVRLQVFELDYIEVFRDVITDS